MLSIVEQLTTQFANLALEAQAIVLIITFIASIAFLEQLLSLGARAVLVVLFILGVLTVGAAAITIGYQVLAPGLALPIAILCSL